MKHCVLIAVCLFLASASLLWAAEPARFFESLPDIPLMEGLEEAEGSGYLFDKAQGRIAGGVAQGAVEVSAIRAYYKGVLPQFGWVLEDEKDLVFRREGEELRVQIRPSDPGAEVQMDIQPAGGVF